MTTLILHKNEYGLKEIYSLEEYYAGDLKEYYAALNVGRSHSYYPGRAQADITGWIGYFIKGVKYPFKRFTKKQKKETNALDLTPLLRELDFRQRKIIELFESRKIISSNEIAEFFNLAPRTARKLAQNWAEEGFLTVVDPSKKPANTSLMKSLKTPLKNPFLGKNHRGFDNF